MKETWEVSIDEESKLKFTIIKSPERFKFSIVYIFHLDEWVDIARIDNYPHEGREETHIHRYKEESVEFRDISFKEAEDTVTRIGNKIKEDIKNGPYRDC